MEGLVRTGLRQAEFISTSLMLRSDASYLIEFFFYFADFKEIQPQDHARDHAHRRV